MSARVPSRTRSFFTGREAFRLVSLVVMLVIIGMTIARLRTQSQTPSAEPPIATAPNTTAQQTAPQKVEPADAAAAEDDSAEAIPSPEEQAEFRKEIQAVLDLATEIHPTEMPAYNRLLSWASALSPQAIHRAEQVRFHDLVKKPDAHRGELVRLRLNVRRVLSYTLPTESAGAQSPEKKRTVYELWGWPVDASGWLYVVVTPELPQGFPTSGPIDQNIEVCGYFFKLQGYHPGNAKPGSKALAAPLVVGRVVQVPPVVVPPSPWLSPWTLGGIFVALAAIAGVWAWSQRGRVRQSVRRGATPTEHPPLPEHAEGAGDTAGRPDRLDSINEPIDDQTEHRPPRPDFDWLREE